MGFCPRGALGCGFGLVCRWTYKLCFAPFMFLFLVGAEGRCITRRRLRVRVSRAGAWLLPALCTRPPFPPLWPVIFGGPRCPVGLMAKASLSGGEDCGFESRTGFILRTLIHRFSRFCPLVMVRRRWWHGVGFGASPPRWPNGQGASLLRRRLRVQVPYEVCRGRGVLPAARCRRECPVGLMDKASPS